MNYRHLRWGTNTENADDRIADGTHTYGESHPTAKATEAEVMEIRRRYADGSGTYASLGAAFGLAPATIAKIVTRQTWAHL